MATYDFLTKYICKPSTSHVRKAAYAGYDNMEVNLEPVLDYLKAQNHKALEHEQSAKRAAGMQKWEVSKVNHFWLSGCLLLTHRLSQASSVLSLANYRGLGLHMLMIFVH